MKNMSQKMKKTLLLLLLHLVCQESSRWKCLLARDNSSHNFHRGTLVWTRETHGLEPTNPRVKSVDLHIHLVRFIISQNHMVIGRLAHPLYIQVNSPLLYRCGILSHMWSISNNVFQQQQKKKKRYSGNTSRNYKNKNSNQYNISNNFSCFECGSSDHFAKDCPKNDKKSSDQKYYKKKKTMLATWDDSYDTTNDEEINHANLCLMARKNDVKSRLLVEVVVQLNFRS